MRKLKKGSNKYKCKFPFKCFNCGKVGHFAAKYSYVKNESSDDEDDHNVKNKHHKKKIATNRTSMKKRTLISRRRSSTQKGSVTCLKKAMKTILIVMEKKLFLWKSKQILMKTKGKI
jgi:DNA-directed RNA polymerase subunit N (RpoN/RPB10)